MCYVDHIREQIYYFETAYNKSPEVIFISTPLYCALAEENVLVSHVDYTTCFGIPIQTFYSENMEYHLSESGFCLDGYCDE